MVFYRPFKTRKNETTNEIEIVRDNDKNPVEVNCGIQVTKDFLFQTLLKHTDKFLFTYEDEDSDGWFIYDNKLYLFTYDFVFSNYKDWTRERPVMQPSSLGMECATYNCMWEDEDENFIERVPIHIILYTDRMFIYSHYNSKLIYTQSFDTYVIREDISRYYMLLTTGNKHKIFFTENRKEEYDGYYFFGNKNISIPFELKRRNILSTDYYLIDVEVSKVNKLMAEYYERGQRKAFFIVFFDDKTYVWDVSSIDFSKKKIITKPAQASCSEDKGKKYKDFYQLSKDEALIIIDTIKPY